LDAKDKTIHDQGLVTILRQIHDDLNQAVLEAYGWQDLAGTVLRNGPANGMRMNDPKESQAVPSLDTTSSTHSHGPPGGRSLPGDSLLLTRLVALNHERAAGEQRGLIRWLRPDYQNCSGGLRPSHDSPAADSSTTATGGHRPPLQTDLPGTATDSQKSKIQNHQSSIVNPSSQNRRSVVPARLARPSIRPSHPHPPPPNRRPRRPRRIPLRPLRPRQPQTRRTDRSHHRNPRRAGEIVSLATAAMESAIQRTGKNICG
jgi:hypothetical protein